jgi:hypothetical protein
MDQLTNVTDGAFGARREEGTDSGERVVNSREKYDQQ